jgi:hypothetical protein
LVKALLQEICVCVANFDFRVGLAEGIPSILSLLISYPAGYFADRRKSELPKDLGQVINILSRGGLGICMGLITTDLAPIRIYWILFVFFCTVQLGQGMLAGTVSAIWNDSLITGTRTRFEVWKRVLYALGGFSGPILSVILISSLKTEKWTIEDMLFPWTLSCCAYIISGGLRLQMSRRRSLPERESGDAIQTNEVKDSKQNIKRKICGCCGYNSIPYLKLISDFAVAIASGMTIKFFPLWLKDLG